ASPNFSTRLQAGFQFNKLDVGPQGLLGSLDSKYGAYDFMTAQHTNADDGITYQNALTLDVGRRRAYTSELAFLLRGDWLGAHEAQAGIQARISNTDRWLSLTGPFVINGADVGHSSYQDRNGGPGMAGLCNDGEIGGVSGGTLAGCSQRTLSPDNYR